MRTCFACIILGTVLSGCQLSGDVGMMASMPSATATPVVTSSPSRTGDSVSEEAISSLLNQLNGSEFDFETASKKENGPVFLAIAKSSKDKNEVVAALSALSYAYTDKAEDEEKNLVDDVYIDVVAEHLRSEDPQIRYWAIDASGLAVGEETNSVILENLTATALEAPSTGERYMALDTLYRSTAFPKNPKVLDTLYRALDDPDPAIRSEVLRFLTSRAFSLANPERFLGKARELTGDKDPGVRGRALDLMASLGLGDSESVASTLVESLKDPHPFPRSEALLGLGFIKFTPAIPDMMPLLEDSQECVYELTYTDMLGETFGIDHEETIGLRVDVAALRGLDSMDLMLSEQYRFDLSENSDLAKDADVAAEVKRARAWFEKNEENLK